MTPEELSERLMSFAARIGKAVDALPDTRMGRHIAGQLVRCGTSPAPNYEEARAAESRADFIHKTRRLSEGTARVALLDSPDRQDRASARAQDG